MLVLPSASRGSIAPLARALRPVQAVMASHRGPADVSGEDEAAASRLFGSSLSARQNTRDER